MQAREICQTHELLAQDSGADESGEERSTSSGDDAPLRRTGDRQRGSRIVALACSGFALIAAVLSVLLGIAYYRGSVAADAAFESYKTYALNELQVPLDVPFGESLEGQADMADFLDRAGRGAQRQRASDLPAVSGTEDSLYPDIDEALSVASDSQRMHDEQQGGGSSAQANLEALNELVRTEINKALEEQQENLNDNMYALVSSNMHRAKLPRTSKMIVDSFEGMESFYIDELDCYKVDSDLTTLTAKAYLRIKGHAGTLTGHIRVRPGNNGAFYRIVLKIYGFWILATPSIDIDFMTQSITAAQVGWIRMGFSSMDGTCYSKSNPSQKDGLCTTILMKKLREKKASVLHQISAKASREVQAGANKFLPFKMPKKPPPPTTPPTTTVPNMTSTAQVTTQAATTALATTVASTTAPATTAPATTTTMMPTTTAVPTTTATDTTTMIS